MSYILDLDTEMFIDLVGKAIEKNFEDRVWDRWLAELPQMDKKTFISFDDYKDKLLKPNATSGKSDEDILRDAESILKMMSR